MAQHNPLIATTFPPALPLKKVVELLSKGENIEKRYVVLCKHLTLKK